MYWSRRNKSDVVVPPRFGLQFEDLKLNPNQITFLYCFVSSCGHITRAAQAARVSRTTHQYWLTTAENKDDYSEAFKRAQPIAAQALLDEAIERAAHGVEEPVFYKGECVGFIKKYSDNLLIQLLKGEMPEKFRERSEVQTGNKPGEVFRIDPGRDVLSDEKLTKLIELGKKLTEEKGA